MFKRVHKDAEIDQLLLKIIETTVDKKRKANYFRHLAEHYQSRDLMTEAIDAINLAIQLDPPNLDYWSRKASLLDENGQTDAAQMLFGEFMLRQYKNKNCRILR